MSDVRLTRTSSWEFDLEFNGSDLVIGDDLETAVVISLLTWARRASDDPDPTPGGDPMGWWADALLPESGDFLGSKLWLTQRAKVTPDVLLQVSQWGEEALQWLVDDRVADSVTVTGERSTIAPDRVDVLVQLKKPGQVVDYRFELNWQAQEARGTT